MNSYALLPLFSFIVVFALGSFTFFRDMRKPLNRVFMLLCLSLAFWSLTEFAYRQTDSFETAHFWLRANAFIYLVPPLLLHFMLIFTGESKSINSKLAYPSIYAPALVFIILSLTTDTMGGEPVKEYWGWTFTLPDEPVLYSIGQIWSYGLGLLSLYLCLLFYLKETEYKKKQQAKHVLIGFLIVVAVALITEWLFPMLQITVPELATISFTAICIFASYAIWKYKLFALTPAAVAENILSTMPDSLLLVSPDHRITLANKAALEMLGYKESELTGQPLEIIFGQNDDNGAVSTEEASEYSEDTSIIGIETTFKTKTDTLIPIFLSRSVMKDREGELLGIIYIGRDITELKLAEEEKRKMEEQLQMTGRLAAVGELSAGVAHELNNPLAAIQAFAEFLASKKDLDDAVKTDVMTIYKEAQRATRITGNLLSFARRNEPERELGSINDILKKSLELHQYQMSLNGVELSVKLAPELPLTMVDSQQMQQVFINIIRNAEQAMIEAHGGGKLHINTRAKDDVIKITFTDDGPGISEEDMTSIFDPFFTTKDVGKGTGLGLSICYGIVEGHGGHIYASSGSGKGTTFVVEIPVITGDRSIAENGDLSQDVMKTTSL
jgi:PAS domain S-box-containing protein